MNLDRLYKKMLEGDFGKFSLTQWVEVLQVYPEYCDKCPCKAMFDDYHIFRILLHQPNLMNKLDVSKLERYHWIELGKYQPEIQTHPMYKLGML